MTRHRIAPQLVRGAREIDRDGLSVSDDDAGRASPREGTEHGMKPHEERDAAERAKRPARGLEGRRCEVFLFVLRRIDERRWITVRRGGVPLLFACACDRADDDRHEKRALAVLHQDRARRAAIVLRRCAQIGRQVIKVVTHASQERGPARRVRVDQRHPHHVVSRSARRTVSATRSMSDAS